MADFLFLQNPVSKKWVIQDPNRSKRPNVGHKAEQACPFCVGRENDGQELYRIGGNRGDSNWQMRVIANKFPFAAIHEIVIHSPDHHKNFEELPLGHIELILQAYLERYRQHNKRGQVYIFHNRGIRAGESIPHPHTQIAVVPFNVKMDIPTLDLGIYRFIGNRSQISSVSRRIKSQSNNSNFKIIKFEFLTSLLRRRNDIERMSIDDFVETKHFLIFCPEASQWSDEVWVAPVRPNTCFGDITNEEITDLAFCIQRLIEIFDMRHGHEFPFNFYIYPGENWYLRIIPRVKTLGGFEIGTGIMVNTQNPAETFAFIKEHFFEPNLYKIRIAQQADYWKSV